MHFHSLVVKYHDGSAGRYANDKYKVRWSDQVLYVIEADGTQYRAYPGTSIKYWGYEGG